MVDDMQGEPVENEPRELSRTVTLDFGDIASKKMWDLGCMTGLVMAVDTLLENGYGPAATLLMDEAWQSYGDSFIERVELMGTAPAGWTTADAMSRLTP